MVTVACAILSMISMAGAGQGDSGDLPVVPRDHEGVRQHTTSGASLSPGPAERAPPLRLELTSWIWAISIDGDLSVRGRTASVDADFIEVLEDSDSLIGLMGRVEAGVGRWALFVDGTYTRVGVDGARGGDVQTELGLVDFGAQFRVIERQMGDGRPLALHLYAGGRYTDLSLSIDRGGRAGAERSESWVDPIVGASLEIPLRERWRVLVRGDVGGFGAASDFAWSATGLVGMDFRLLGMPATAYAGYRGVGADYDDGARFAWDSVIHGPMLGLTIRF